MGFKGLIRIEDLTEKLLSIPFMGFVPLLPQLSLKVTNTFQFPLWDSQQVICQYLLTILPFNSLYGIQLKEKELEISQIVLSIPFMGFLVWPLSP